ncbi:MAG: hypothetical protein ACLQPD_19015 [Desulfomonilaceae bacterium]
MNEAESMARAQAYRFANALKFLDSCPKLTCETFVEVNRIASDELSEYQLRQWWKEMELAIAMKGGGELRAQLRQTFQKGLNVFGHTANGLKGLE